MAITLPPLVARTVSLSAFAQVQGWQSAGPLHLVLYSTTATDGLVWVSTQDGIDGASNSVTGVPDRRPLTPPCSFYLGPYSALAIGPTSTEGSVDITMELTPHPVQPVRVMASLDATVSPANRNLCER